MPELEVPDEFHDWPFDAKRFVLAEAKTVEDLREEIDSLVGLNHEEVDGRQAGQFRKDQLAAIVMALGGPQGDGSNA